MTQMDEDGSRRWRRLVVMRAFNVCLFACRRARRLGGRGLGVDLRKSSRAHLRQLWVTKVT
jgi:hypothetical protein